MIQELLTKKNEKDVEFMKGFGKFIRGKLFSLLFAFFSLLSVFYVSDRMGKLFACFFSKNLQNFFFILLALLMGYMLFYIKSSKELKKTRNFYEFCSVLLCFLLYLVVFLWIFDLTDLVFHFNEDRLYVIPVLGSFLLTFYGFSHAKHLYIKHYSIHIKHMKQEKKLVLLSDIHLGTFVNIEQLKRIIEKVNQLHADIIVIAGDLFDVDAFAYCDKEKIAKELRTLSPHKNIYAVLGNHDPASSTEEIKEFYEQAQIKLLIDDIKETEDFIIIGRDDVTVNPSRKDLESILMEIHHQKPYIVLDHNPSGISEAAEQKMDLVLCGHTHKGQFFPANIFTKLAYGKQGYYGYYTNGTTQSVVSSGAGYFQMPMRVGSNSEIVVLHLSDEIKNP